MANEHKRAGLDDWTQRRTIDSPKPVVMPNAIERADAVFDRLTGLEPHTFEETAEHFKKVTKSIENERQCEHCYHTKQGPIMMWVPDGHVVEECCKCHGWRTIHRSHAHELNRYGGGQDAG